MGDPDHLLALLIQKQTEHESNYKNDRYLAQRLQEDFNKEISIENSAALTYDHKKKTIENAPSLTDPSWELIDPTPDIYNLFVGFNQRYFWNKLLAVCVSWSKRMTSCAGVCSYQGRAGMCSITLSEPLLKLRPRKDLVETLLHEMIHAYLFVTHNNRDRDGHGPEFHKHMHRINQEAGTNITVYHSFHDEVRLYQQHWWRCNGPCQNLKPYFGIVRRAINRAPGPNDRWWGEHLRVCGGTYTKVKEPEKKGQTQKENKSDIRNFITVTNKNSSISVNTQQNPQVCQVPGVGNVHGFINLSIPQYNVTKQLSNGRITKKRNDKDATTKTKSNSNSTIVVNKKPTNLAAQTNQTSKTEIHIFSGTGKSLTQSGETPKKHEPDDYSSVRNHWINKFPSSSSQINKRNIIESTATNSKKQKMQRLPNQNDVLETVNLDDSSVGCPVCEKQIKESLLNNHLDSCLLQKENKPEETQQCFVCNDKIPRADYRNHIDSCIDNKMSDEDDLEDCEICSMWFLKSNIETHRKSCIENLFASTSTQDLVTSASKKPTSSVVSQCSICDDFFDEKELNQHKEKCLLGVITDLEKKHNLNLDQVDREVSCLVCSKKVVKSELNTHLDECMSGVFDEKNDFNQPCGSKAKPPEQNTHECDSTNGTHAKYNCPFCLDLYSELDMSGHLDQCLVSDGDSDNNKSILIDSFSSE